MNVYLDLSFLVNIFFIICSLFYSKTLDDKILKNKWFYLNNFFLSILSFVVNMFFIPYFHVFMLFLLTLFPFIFNRRNIVGQLIFVFYYLLNNSFLILVGGTTIFKGILLINVPYVCLFAFALPLLSAVIMFVISCVNMKVKKNLLLAKLEVNGINKYIKAFLDTGNNLMHQNIPVIFINFDIIYPYEKEIIIVKTINGKKAFEAMRGKVIYNNITYKCFVIFLDEKFNSNCNCLFNNQIL